MSYDTVGYVIVSDVTVDDINLMGLSRPDAENGALGDCADIP
jgi:hypothetical protein